MSEWLRRIRGALLVLAFLSVFLYIFSLNFGPPARMDVLQRSVVETLGPVIRSLGKVSLYFEDGIKGYVWLRQVRQENERLNQHIAKLEQRVTSYHEAYVEEY